MSEDLYTRCELTGLPVPRCWCGPYLQCPEHFMNCVSNIGESEEVARWAESIEGEGAMRPAFFPTAPQGHASPASRKKPPRRDE